MVIFEYELFPKSAGLCHYCLDVCGCQWRSDEKKFWMSRGRNGIFPSLEKEK